QRTASPESLIGILRELGAPLESLADSRQALFETDFAHWRTLAPPVCVSWGGNGIRLTLRLPEAQMPEAVEWSLRLESGEERSGRSSVADLTRTRRVELGSERFTAKSL